MPRKPAVSLENVPKLYNWRVSNSYAIKPTKLQIRAVNAVLEGETNLGKAMRLAGYSAASSLNPRQNFVDSHGVQVFLQTLDERARLKFNMTALEKVFDVYLEALKANKFIPIRTSRNGKPFNDLVQIKDHAIRIMAADRIVRLSQIAAQTIQ
jgi:hypothetical protein